MKTMMMNHHDIDDDGDEDGVGPHLAGPLQLLGLELRQLFPELLLVLVPQPAARTVRLVVNK